MDRKQYIKVKQIAAEDWQSALDDLAQQAKPAPAKLNLVRMVYDDPKAPQDVYKEAFRALMAMERNRSQPKGTVAETPLARLARAKMQRSRDRSDRNRAACQEAANDIGCLLDMIGQAVNAKLGPQADGATLGTLIDVRNSLMDVLVRVGDLEESAIRETLMCIRADAHAAKVSEIPGDGGDE